MSVGDSFTLLPLSKFFVKKTVVPGPDPNLGQIQPIASGNVTGSNVSGGTYTWYQVFHFGGNANTQGVELKTYAFVVRGFTTTTGTGNTDPIPLPQAFDSNNKVYNFFYDNMTTSKANYLASVNSTGTGIRVNFTVLGPNNQTPIDNDSFMFLVWGF
jgi:hypothetical protein